MDLITGTYLRFGKSVILEDYISLRIHEFYVKVCNCLNWAMPSCNWPRFYLPTKSENGQIKTGQLFYSKAKVQTGTSIYLQ